MSVDRSQHPRSPLRWIVAASLLLPISAAAAAGNDPLADTVGAGPDVSALTSERTTDGVEITITFDSAISPPTTRGDGLFGLIDLDSDADPTTGQQASAGFLLGYRFPSLALNGLGVDHQLVLSTYDAADGAVDLVDQHTSMTVARVPLVFAGNTVRATLTEAHLPAASLDDLRLAAVVGTNDTISDAAPNQGHVTTANEDGATLHDGRFSVQVSWTTAQGESGVGTVVTKSTDSVLFWFFQETNWELLVKVLNGCPLTNSYWVYSAATTDVEFTLSVTDNQTGTVRLYRNEQGVAAPAITDTAAFSTCS